MPLSALIVRVPEAEGLVSDLRDRHDPSAAGGAPAHITVLVPFKYPNELSSHDIERLAAVFRTQPAFAYSLASVGRWPDTAFLMPSHHQRFINLTAEVVRAFPTYRPYSGRHGEVVPHLTVADGSEQVASEVELELSQRLLFNGAVQANCNQIELIENSSGRWEVMHVFPLASSDA